VIAPGCAGWSSDIPAGRPGIEGRAGDKLDIGTLGAVLRRLHELPRPAEFDLPSEDILSRAAAARCATSSRRDIMGWSNSKVAKRYSHVTAAIQNSIAAQINTLLWGPQ
jgi:hypothetical protein